MAGEIDRIVARTKAKPLGPRQELILAYARMRISGGQSFPTTAEIKAFLNYPNGEADLFGSVLGLAARGLIASTKRVRTARGMKPDGWVITEAGWAA